METFLLLATLRINSPESKDSATSNSLLNKGQIGKQTDSIHNHPSRTFFLLFYFFCSFQHIGCFSRSVSNGSHRYGGSTRSCDREPTAKCGIGRMAERNTETVCDTLYLHVLCLTLSISFSMIDTEKGGFYASTLLHLMRSDSPTPIL